MNDPAPRGLWNLSIAFGLLLIAVAGLLLVGTYWGDPAIYLPYARNAAAGDPFSFNPGRFSSGSTSPLWGLLLAIPYLVGLGHVGAKILAMLATMGSVVVVAAATSRVNGRSFGSGLPLLYAVEMLTIFGLMMYESPLVVAAVAASILAGEKAVTAWRASGSLAAGDVLPLALVWAVLPLTRPDATVLVPLQLACLWLFGPGRSVRALGFLIMAAGVAALPSAAYYGYSLVELGMVSVSSDGRAFALREAADRLGPIFVSRAALGYLGGILYAVALAALGYDLLRREPDHRWLASYGICALVVYPILLVFISPVTNDLPRYFLPVAPFVVIGAGRALGRIAPSGAGHWSATAALVLILFVVKPTAVVVGEAVSQSSRGYSFDEIVEKEAIDLVNRVAAPGDTLLAYEVQDRYALRADVTLLSLDGITDGLVNPWLESGDMGGFLHRYRPDYWLANDAVDYRPYLRRSILSDVVRRFRQDTSAATHEVEGIRFSLIARRSRPMPRGFAGWRMLLQLDYLDTPG